MKDVFRRRRVAAICAISAVIVVALAFASPQSPSEDSTKNPPNASQNFAQKSQKSDNSENSAPSQNTENSDNSASSTPRAADILAQLAVKGRAPMTGYSRAKFGGSWSVPGGCDMRNQILRRDLTELEIAKDGCKIERGKLADPYTGREIDFVRGVKTSSAVQIDHVVAIGNAWQTGAQNLSQSMREKMYLDPLELLAVDGPANEQKSDGDAATWLPPNKNFRCTYVARQIAVKQKYALWVTASERDAMAGILAKCPDERIPAP